MIIAACIGAGFLLCAAIVTALVCVAPLFDENEQPIDDITDDPRPAMVLREAWADRETRGVGL